jgi:aryl-alcohol dehydrogenase-like predicted oxidoreductase
MSSLAVAWVLKQQGVAAALVGARTPEQFKGNVEAVDLELSAEVIERLNAATDQVKKIMGPNADMWRTASRIR